MRKKLIYRESVKGRYGELKKHSKRRGLALSISLEEYEELTTGKLCFYCYGPLPTQGSGLDRLINSKPYTLDNVVPCCGPCNVIKGPHLSPREMMAAMAVIGYMRKEPL